MLNAAQLCAGSEAQPLTQICMHLSADACMSGAAGKMMEMKELGSTMIRAALCTVLASPAVQEQPPLALGAVAATAAGSLDYYTVRSKQAPGRGIAMKGIFAGASA